MNTVTEKFEKLGAELNSRLIERREIVKSCFLAVLAEEHCFFLGPPGTAKSLTVELFCSAIEGANYFRTLLTRFTQPEELYGPPSLRGLQNDIFERLTAGYAPDAHILFLDEIWKASSSILNTFLTMINERIFTNGKQVLEVPLISLFTASNELPEDSSLDALYDRFLLRHYVDRIADESNFRALLRVSQNGPVQNRLTLEEIAQAQLEVKMINVDPVLNTVVDLRSKLEREGFIFSDRRWCKSLRLLQAKAYLGNRSSVNTEDLETYADILWEKPDQRKSILRLILSVASPHLEQMLECFDMATEIYREALNDGSTAAGMEANDKLRGELLPQMEKLPQSDRGDEMIRQVKAYQREIAEVCLGF